MCTNFITLYLETHNSLGQKAGKGGKILHWTYAHDQHPTQWPWLRSPNPPTTPTQSGSAEKASVKSLFSSQKHTRTSIGVHVVWVWVLQDGRGGQAVRVVVLVGVNGHQAPVTRRGHQRRWSTVDDAGAGDSHGGHSGDARSQDDGGAGRRRRGCSHRKLQWLSQETVSICRESRPLLAPHHPVQSWSAYQHATKEDAKQVRFPLLCAIRRKKSDRSQRRNSWPWQVYLTLQWTTCWKWVTLIICVML